MSRELDAVLDECLRQIRGGQADVETCLARYPQYAQDLGGLLRTAELLRAARPPEPRPEAVLRGEHRLAAVLAQKRASRNRASARGRLIGLLGRMRELARQRKALNSSQPSWPLGRRMAGAAVTVTLLLALGFGTAAAASRSLPGQFLYPVKRATERVQLALSFSDGGKAGLQMALAERRIQELSEVGSAGKTEQVAMLASEVTQSLKQAGLGTRLASSSQSRSKVEASASRQLATLEVSLAEAPEEVKPAVAEALAVAGAEYGAAVEAAARKSPPPQAAWARLGTIQVRVSDPPPPPVDSVLVVVGKVEAQRVAGAETHWVTIVDRPVTFDLLKVAQVQKLLGSRQVPEGTYTQVRFTITSARVAAGGREHAVTVPGEELKLVRPFQVREGEVTLVVLDFDGSRSLTVSDEGEFKLRPSLKLLVPSDSRLVDSGRGKEKTVSAPNQPGAALVQGSGIKETRVEIEGTVETVGGSYLVIGGQTVAVDGLTQWKAAPGTGESAEVLAVVQPDGSFLARVIEVDEDLEGGDSEDGDSDDDGERDGEKVAASTPTPTPHLPSPTSGPSLVAGADGVREPTAVAPPPTATPRPPSPTPTPKPRDGEDDRDGERLKTPTPSPTPRAPSPTPTPARSHGDDDEDDEEGPAPTPTATPRPVSPSPTAAPTPTRTPTPAPREPGADEENGQTVEIEGIIQDLSLGQWIIVNGKKVLLSSDTRIEGKLGVGVACEVTAVVQRDGTLVASVVEVEDEEGTDATAPQPTATPTPLPTAVPTATQTPLPTATAAAVSIRTGAILYSTYCATCHGAASSSNIAGEETSETKSAVRTGPGSMPVYGSSTISDAELNNLANYAASLP